MRTNSEQTYTYVYIHMKPSSGHFVLFSGRDGTCLCLSLSLSIMVNSSSRVLFLQFVEQQWDYSAPLELKCLTDNTLPQLKHLALARSSTPTKNERTSRTLSLSQRMRSLSAPKMQHSHGLYCSCPSILADYWIVLCADVISGMKSSYI